MKRFFSMVLGLVVVATSCITALAVQAEGNGAFKVISIPYVEEGENNSQRVVKARYVNTKEAIPLSLIYADRLYATVPYERADEEIEAFETKELEFTDNNDSQYEFHIMKELSRTGVIKGNDKGQALPFANITRAEATSMLLRFLGLKQIAINGPAKIFEDVTTDDWFYREVLSAYHYGLIKGDSANTFSPDRAVTREEFAVMAARAVKFAGLSCPGDENFNVADKDKISDWAKDAYTVLGNYVETDADETDTENPKIVLNPQESATRWYAADLLYDIQPRVE